jgi:hypothetical protein
MIGAARCSRSTPELACDGAKSFRLVEREPQKPAIPVAEPHAADLTPGIGPLARAVVERDLGWQLEPHSVPRFDFCFDFALSTLGCQWIALEVGTPSITTCERA